MKKILLGLATVLLGLPILLAIAVWVGERRRYEAPYPAVHARADAETIERGRYLVRGPGHCDACHGAAGHAEDPPMSGGMVFHLPLGDVTVPNITPDVETGIGALRDEEIARILRHGVHHDGRVVLPFMRFGQVSDEDLTAILSYLRSQPPVRHAIERYALNPLGRIVRALVLRPVGPTAPPPVHVEVAPTVERGRYLTEVANCVGCHTKVDMRTGSLVGPLFAGGNVLPGHTGNGKSYAPPNLTAAEKTGRITQWTEDLFVARLQTGTGAEGSPMPWLHYSRMREDDLRAIYRYLRSLPAVENDTGPAVRDPEGGPRLASETTAR